MIGWSFGAGMVPYVAGVDHRVKSAVSVAGWGDGERWLKSLRRYYEWLDLLDRIDRDGKSRVLTGKSEADGAPVRFSWGPFIREGTGARGQRDTGDGGFKSTAYSLATAAKLREFKTGRRSRPHFTQGDAVHRC